MTLGPLRLVGEVYVPFRVFRLDIRNKKTETVLLAVDALAGTLDPYTLDKNFSSTETTSAHTRNAIEPVLIQSQAAQFAINHARRIVFRRGFLHLRNLQITAACMIENLYVPYWVGFYGADSRARLSVISALSGRAEGAKLRGLLHDWLCASSEPANLETRPQSLIVPLTMEP